MSSASSPPLTKPSRSSTGRDIARGIALVSFAIVFSPFLLAISAPQIARYSVKKANQWLPKNRTSNSRQRRCGGCLFQLDKNISILETDHALHDLIPPETSGKAYGMATDFQISSSIVDVSAKRGCKICKSLKKLPKYSHSSHHWRKGRLRVEDNVYQVFTMQDHEAIPVEPLLALNPYIGVGNSPSRHIPIATALETAMIWSRCCRQDHRNCFTEAPGPMPKRLLHIEAFDDWDSPKIRVVEGANALPPQEYVCLSHRWGPMTQKSSLSRHNVHILTQAVPPSMLYPLLKDAIEVVWRLGFRYLWVDCLCICQDSDDLSDWHSQAPYMADVYSNAALTISALSSDPGGQGPEILPRLLDKRDNQTYLLGSTEIGDAQLLCKRENKSIYLRPQKWGTHPFYLNNSTCSIEQVVNAEKYPLSTRGWAFQERMLSRRTLHFTSTELVWECREAIRCECRDQETLLAYAKNKSEPDMLGIRWHSIVADYSRTLLTRESDRLPALSGTAKRFGELRGWTSTEYLAGIWKEEMPWGLLWFCTPGRSRARSKAPDQSPVSRLPSWSWASCKTAVRFDHNEEGDKEALVRVVSHSVSPGPNPFGTPESAALVVEGPTVEVQVWIGEGYALFVQLPGEAEPYPLHADYQFDPLLEQFLLLVVCVREKWLRGLVLIGHEQKPDTYRRCGYLLAEGSVGTSRSTITLV